MGLRTKVIGRDQTEHGEYVPGQAYGKKFIVTLFDCGWESKHENNTSAPATLNAQAGTITENTTDWKKKWGSYKQWLIDNGYQKMDASKVKDGNNTQHDINATFANEIGSDSTPGSIKGRVTNLEGAVGTGGSVDERIATEGAKHYLKSETYNKEEVNNLITTPNQEYVSVTATALTTAVTDVLPSTGASDTTYRVGNWDGTQYNESEFSEYAWNGSAYIKLSTKSQVGEVYDISANHADAKYADLAAALNGGANIPQSLQKGGMSIKFVQSSDNKYVQYRLMTDDWSTDTEDWAIVGEGVYVKNLEFVAAYLDSEKRILFGVHTDGNFYFGAGVPKQIVDYVESKFKYVTAEDIKVSLESDTTIMQYLNETYGEYVENPEFIKVWLDNEDKVLFGVKKNGDVMFGYGIPSQIASYISERIKETNEDISAIQAFLEGFSDTTLLQYLDETYGKYIDDPEGRTEIKIDSKEKVVSYRDGDGRLHENVGIKTNSIHLSEEGMTEFKQALKDSGFQPGGGGDWSERNNIELPEPKHYALLNIIVDNLPINDSDVSEGYVQYYDGLGNYFKLTCELAAQGQTSRIFARTGGKGNYTLDLPKDVKFGSWVPQDSFHLKGCAKDVVRGILPTSYKWAYMFMEYLDAKPNRVLLKDDSEITTTHASGDRMTDWGDGARCLPDGFPVEVYINGEYWGLYSWQLKKHRKNYSMDKKDYSSCFIDADVMMTDDYTHGIWNDGPDDRTYRASSWWTGFDIKGPKDLICMDGSKFDGDNPKELIDNTSEYYDASNKAHKGSAQTKAIIRAFQTKYLEVKTLIDNNDIDGAKAKFNDNFDYNACMQVYIFNCLMRNTDSVKKNTLWGTYKDGKVFPALWDLDGMYGQSWIGNTAVSPTTSTWNTYANAAWPLGLFWALYESEIKAAYAELRRNGIISINTWKPIVFGWVNRIGTEAYDRDIEKWPETPSYRENYTNIEYWTEVGVRSGTGGYPVWNNSDSYAANDNVVIKLHDQSTWYMRYRAVQANTGVCPVTQFYEKFPIVGGFYDSPKRWEKWMEEQIILCDIQNDYFAELIADFTAYRNTDPDYTIQCNDMYVEHAVSSEYQFIEGHITRHEEEVEGQTVSTYTITGGNVTDEDTSKTYTTVAEAINTASSQEADVPSGSLYYIKARAKDISYHK